MRGDEGGEEYLGFCTFLHTIICLHFDSNTSTNASTNTSTTATTTATTAATNSSTTTTNSCCDNLVFFTYQRDLVFSANTYTIFLSNVSQG